jgi:hypothetical protein
MSPDDPEAEQLKQDLIRMILWADANSARSLQTEIGPSEIATRCDRQLGYRLAQVAPVNTFHDPWAAIVGTAIHGWLEKAVNANGDPSWLTERELLIDEWIPAHSDLYHDGVVIDHKTVNKDKLVKIGLVGAQLAVPDNITQIQLYGKAFTQAGLPVRKVALVFYPRAGRLRDAKVWVGDYDPAAADAAMDRVYAIAQQVVDLEVMSNPHRWEQVPAFPSDACGLCPMYDPNKVLETGADDTGCPGGR